MAVALITGCSSGIGKYTALEMARRGHRVFASMRNLESARFIQTDAEKAQLTIELLQLDVTDPASVMSAVQQVLKQAGAIDILVNNAGRGSIGVVEDYTDEEIRSVFETNFFGAVRTTRAVLPAMRATVGNDHHDEFGVRTAHFSLLFGLFGEQVRSGSHQ
jgi:NAD(P)-dependent dehydrogenase (short-subunit alcohol dehydrogenase family)